jgi:hypothetical protein
MQPQAALQLKVGFLTRETAGFARTANAVAAHRSIFLAAASVQAGLGEHCCRSHHRISNSNV